MDWQDDAIVLSARRHGETSAIAMLLTYEHGRHAGLVRGGAGKRMRGLLQPGNMVHAHWRGRLAEHLGTYTIEAVAAGTASIMADPDRLAALSAACAVAETALPEREPAPAVYEALGILLRALGDDAPSWPSVYVKWEIGLLETLGFGLDLSSCAANGTLDDLVYVSPKSGRAVSAEAGAPYRDVLLPLPAFLGQSGTAGSAAEIADGLRLTGYFLGRHVFGDHATAPAARARLQERMRRAAGRNSVDNSATADTASD